MTNRSKQRDAINQSSPLEMLLHPGEERPGRVKREREREKREEVAARRETKRDSQVWRKLA